MRPARVGEASGPVIASPLTTSSVSGAYDGPDLREGGRWSQGENLGLEFIFSTSKEFIFFTSM